MGALKAFSGETIVRSNALVGSACAPPSQPPASAGLLRYFEPSANREFQVLLVKLLESHRIRVRVKPAHEGAIRIRESREERLDRVKGTTLRLGVWIIDVDGRFLGAPIDPDLFAGLPRILQFPDRA